MIDTISTWKYAWYVSLNILLTETSNVWTNVVRFTSKPDSDWNQMGDRIPMLMIKENTNQLYVCTGLNDNPNHFDAPIILTLNQWTAIEVTQIQEGSKYYFIVNVDGDEVEKVENTKPQMFSDVKVYLSDNFWEPAKAMVQNLTYYNLPEGKIN